MRILVIEDDERILKNLSDLLVKDAYAVDIASNLADGMDKALSDEYDLLIVDWMFPTGVGTELISSLRQQDIHTPVLLLTAKSQQEDVVTGLNTGADDYVIKPYDADILRARVRALVRRQVNQDTSPILTSGNLLLDSNAHEVKVDNREVKLTTKEYSVLEYLLRHKNKAVNRMDLFAHGWDEQANLFSNNVDVYVLYLRKKLKRCTAKIKTIKGLGYKLCDP